MLFLFERYFRAQTGNKAEGLGLVVEDAGPAGQQFAAQMQSPEAKQVLAITGVPEMSCWNNWAKGNSTSSWYCPRA